MTAPADVRPVAAGERIDLLDVLRGVAIFGILIANMTVVSGYFLHDEVARAMLPTARLDAVADLGIRIFLEGKFYSIFSLLFGFGFAVQLGRAGARGADFAPLFRRRLWGLVLIGLAHAVLIWFGDILLLYALLGFLLLAFRGAADRTLLRGAILCLALPVVIYLLLLAAGVGDPFAGAAASDGEGADVLAIMVFGWSEGNWFDAFRSNLIGLAGRWVDLFVTLRFPKVFGMFLLGFYLGRGDQGARLLADRARLARVARLGLGIGLPANLLMAVLETRGVYLPASPLGLVQVVAASVGVPALAFGYAALVALLFGTPGGARLLRGVAPAGRMALTNYLMHSVVMVVMFYHWGLGWYGRLGSAITTGLALLICALQVPLSAWWLSRFRFGPVEWLWRQFTYRQRIPLRREA